MYAFVATFWTFDVAFFVFRKSKGYFKWLLATFAVELIARHGDLRKNVRAVWASNLWCTLQNRWRQGTFCSAMAMASAPAIKRRV